MKKNHRKWIVYVLCFLLGLSVLAGCGRKQQDQNEENTGNEETQNNEGTVGDGGNNAVNDQKQGRVFYLNFKPESAEIWGRLATDYTTETGVEMKIQTAASGSYEQTLKSEIAKKDAPTLFQINGPVGYQNWKNYCLDLSDTDLYSWMLDPDLAVTGEDGGVYGIPYVVEGYGIIYNQEILDRYFALEDQESGINSAEEIRNFDTLEQVVEDMTDHKEELGIDGVFASTSFAQGEEWRWHTHLANLPVYYEFEENGVTDADELILNYGENFRNIFDLYIENSVTEPAMLGNKSINDSMAEFALGRAAMIQNGSWAWSQIADVAGNTVKEENVKFLPIYTGVEGEEGQGLCIGTENFFAVNSQASPEDQQAAIDFLEWLFESETGKRYVTEEFGFITPFNTFTEEETPQDPLAQEVLRYMENPNLTSVSWNFTAFPSQIFKDKLGAALLEYTQGRREWEEVLEVFRQEWKNEKQNAGW